MFYPARSFAAWAGRRLAPPRLLQPVLLQRGDALQVLEHALERLDVPELRVDVEQVPLDDARDAVADALADDDRTEALGDRVLRRVPHAPGHRHAGDDHRVDPERGEEARQVRPVEGAGALLDDHVLVRL